MRNWVAQSITTTGATAVGTVLSLGSAVADHLAVSARYATGVRLDYLVVTDDTGAGINRMIVDATLTTGTPDTLTIDAVHEKLEGGALAVSPASGLTLSGVGPGGVRVDVSADANLLHRTTDLEIITPATVDANQTGVVNRILYWDLSALTVVRDFTLPATARVGDRVGVLATLGHATLAARVLPAAGDAINADAAGVERTRLLTTGEYVIYRCVSAGTSLRWAAEVEQLVPTYCRIDGVGGANQTLADVTWTTVAGTCLANAAADDFGMADTVNGRINFRRSGTYVGNVVGICGLSGTGDMRMTATMPVSGDVLITPKDYVAGTQPSTAIGSAFRVDIAADAYLYARARQATGASNNLQASTGTYLEVLEQL